MIKGTWIVQYDSIKYDPSYILETIVNREYTNNITKSKLDNICTQNLSNMTVIKVTDQQELPSGLRSLNNGKKIRSLALTYPVLMNDKRWETIHLTTSTLFLGSALTEHGFEVVNEKQVLPSIGQETHLLNNDAIGFTLFEDLFLPFRDFLQQLKEQQGYKGLLAAGGPMITLNPLESAFHLPGLNLLVRGEAEIVLPALLEAINNNDIKGMLQFSGFLFQVPGLLVISNLDRVNRPAHLKNLRFRLEFLKKEHLDAGLEINVSRGCHRGCIFCSAVQGKALRQLPLAQFDDLLTSFSQKLTKFKVHSPHARTVNINDDDILQDPQYAAEVFNIIKAKGFRLWGVQTSINSFFNKEGHIDQRVIDIVADKSLYMDENPLVWLGTDAFLKERGKKLAKLIPDEETLLKLLSAFETHGVRNYHYWISSDHRSNWNEFCQEFMLIYRLMKRFKDFSLIAHAPFLVPYSTTPLYTLLNRNSEMSQRVKYKKILEASTPWLRFPLVERVETSFVHLNRLLNNEKLAGNPGFFDCINQKDYLQGAITIYNFLKQERMDAESMFKAELIESLKQTESEIESFISNQL
jgi:hypothetical protein